MLYDKVPLILSSQLIINLFPIFVIGDRKMHIVTILFLWTYNHWPVPSKLVFQGLVYVFRYGLLVLPAELACVSDAGQKEVFGFDCSWGRDWVELHCFIVGHTVLLKIITLYKTRNDIGLWRSLDYRMEKFHIWPNNQSPSAYNI